MQTKTDKITQNMKATKHLLIAAATMTLAACSNDNEPTVNDNPVAAKVYAGINTAQSRAAGTKWSNGDRIGIIGSNMDAEYKALYDNVPYVTNNGDGNFTPVGDGIFFQNTDEGTFRAYYPYKDEDDLFGGVSGTAIIAKTQDQSRQEQFDFLFASGAKASRSNPAINFSGDNAFRHCMSQLVINITTSDNDGFSSTDVFNGQYFVNGLMHVGFFYIYLGRTELDSGQNDNWDITTAPHTDNDTEQRRTYSLILFPQNVSKEFKAVIDGQSYACTLPDELAAGYSYTYNVVVKKTGATVESATITDWTDGGSTNVDATMPTE